MIKSREEYKKYVEADRLSLGRKHSLKAFIFDDIWRFQRLMRRLEYLTNCKSNRLLRAFTAYQYSRLGKSLGFSIPINVFGPGLSIAHSGTIVINGDTRIGSNCRIHVCVNIGTEAGKSSETPTIGDNCYIAPGAKLFGKIHIGDNVVIAANAVVNKSFPDGNATIGGIPAKTISKTTSVGLLNKGFEQ